MVTLMIQKPKCTQADNLNMSASLEGGGVICLHSSSVGADRISLIHSCLTIIAIITWQLLHSFLGL